MPRAFFYAYTFLVSTIVQLDPVGEKPKCILYATAGLTQLGDKLQGGDPEVFPMVLSMQNLSNNIAEIAAVTADLLYYQAILNLQRSRYDEAETVGRKGHDAHHAYLFL